MFANNKKQRGAVVPALMLTVSIFGFIAWQAQKTQIQFSVIASQIAMTNETRVKMNNAATVILGYAVNSDDDDYLEPPEYVEISGNPSVDSFARYETDSWGESFVYCPYDIGDDGHNIEAEKDPSQNLFKGNGATTIASNSNIIIALISKGKDKKLDSSCNAVDLNGNVGPSIGGDDIVMTYPHAMALHQSENTSTGYVDFNSDVFASRATFEAQLGGLSAGSIHKIDIQNMVGGFPVQEYNFPLVFNKTGLGAISMGLSDLTTGSSLKMKKSNPHFLELIGPTAQFKVNSTSGGVLLDVNEANNPGIHVGSSASGFSYKMSIVEDGVYLRRSLSTSSSLENPKGYISKTKGIKFGDYAFGDIGSVSLDPRNDLGLHFETSSLVSRDILFHINVVGPYPILTNQGLFLFKRKLTTHIFPYNISVDAAANNGSVCSDFYRGRLMVDASFKIMVCN